MSVHCITIEQNDAGGGVTALCGATILAMEQLSDVTQNITCEHCIVKLLARLHGDQAILLGTLVKSLEEFRAQVQKAARRD